MTAPTLAQLQAAIQAAVVTSSGLATGNVVYGFKSAGTYLPDCYIRIHLGASTRKPIIETWAKHTLDSDATTTVAITQRVTLDCYHRSPETSGSVLQDTMLRLQTRLVTNILNTAGVSIFRYGDVSVLPAPTQSTYLDRAVADLTVHFLTSYTAPTAPSIQTLNGSVEAGPSVPPEIVLFTATDV